MASWKKFVPTFYVEPCWGGFAVLVSNSDNNNQTMLLAKGYDKASAIANAKKKYFGKSKPSDEIKVVYL
jgi:hypothetical protein